RRLRRARSFGGDAARALPLGARRAIAGGAARGRRRVGRRAPRRRGAKSRRAAARSRRVPRRRYARGGAGGARAIGGDRAAGAVLILRRVRLESFRCFAEPLELGPLDERITVVYGPNGAGKSTLLHALERALFDRPDG